MRPLHVRPSYIAHSNCQHVTLRLPSQPPIAAHLAIREPSEFRGNLARQLLGRHEISHARRLFVEVQQFSTFYIRSLSLLDLLAPIVNARTECGKCSQRAAGCVEGISDLAQLSLIVQGSWEGGLVVEVLGRTYLNVIGGTGRSQKDVLQGSRGGGGCTARHIQQLAGQCCSVAGIGWTVLIRSEQVVLRALAGTLKAGDICEATLTSPTVLTLFLKNTLFLKPR